MLALINGNFSASMLDFLEQRHRNVRSLTAAVERCAVTTGLLILLKATGHGKDPLAEVCEIDTHNWDDHGRLRRKLDKTLKYLADRALMLRLVRCDDSFAQRACLNRELQDE